MPNENQQPELTVEEVAANKAAAKAQKLADAKVVKDAKTAASVVAKDAVKAQKAADKILAAEAAAALVVKKTPKTAEEKRLAINAATALRRSTPEGKAYAAAAAAKSYAKKTAPARLAKQEAADLAALEALAGVDAVPVDAVAEEA